MAVVVQCYHCSNILELDEGFRGGVCRCSQCGALLQVPKGSSTEMRKARPAAPGASPTDVKRPGTPLDDPGLSRGQFDPRSPRLSPSDEGISSGAFGRVPSRPAAPVAAVRRPQASRPVACDPALEVRRNNTLLYLGIALVVLVTLVAAVAIIAWILSHMKDTDQLKSGAFTPPAPAIASPVPSPPPVPAPPPMAGPNFFTVPLVGRRIVFSVDTGTAGQDTFDYVRKGLERSIASLADDQQFKMAWWKESGTQSSPESGWQNKAGAAGINKEIERTGTMGSTDAAACMTASLQLGGDQVVFITSKPLLPAELAATVLAARQPNQRIDAVTTVAEEGSPLEEIALKGNGKFVRANRTLLESVILDPKK